MIGAPPGRRHGLTVSFSPLPVADGAGNGAHLHLSLFRNGMPLLSGGPCPHGLSRYRLFGLPPPWTTYRTPRRGAKRW